MRCGEEKHVAPRFEPRRELQDRLRLLESRRGWAFAMLLSVSSFVVGTLLGAEVTSRPTTCERASMAPNASVGVGALAAQPASTDPAATYRQEYALTYFPDGPHPRYGQHCSCDILECFWTTPDHAPFAPSLDPNRLGHTWQTLQVPIECRCTRGSTRCVHMYMP